MAGEMTENRKDYALDAYPIGSRGFADVHRAKHKPTSQDGHISSLTFLEHAKDEARSPVGERFNMKCIAIGRRDPCSPLRPREVSEVFASSRAPSGLGLVLPDSPGQVSSSRLPPTRGYPHRGPGR